MPNHYHLLVQTPEANISRSMCHINGFFTQRFNRRHGFDGQLFRGRYKSILIDADNYLLQLVRYIHRNPIKAGIATLDDYPWSSHKGYLSIAKKWEWIKGWFYELRDDNEVPQIRELAPEPEELIAAVCDVYGVNQIGTRFRIQNYSSENRAIERLKIKMQKDRKLRKRAEKLLDKQMRRRAQIALGAVLQRLIP